MTLLELIMKKILLVVVFILAMSTQVNAGSYGMASVNSFTDWETECYKPSRPYFYVSDVESYNMAVQQFNSYVGEVEDYLQCIQREGDDDARTLLRAVEEGISNESTKALNELDQTKSELLSHKLYIQ